MLCVCISSNKVLRSKLLKALAILYGIVAVSDLACFYLVLAMQDWQEYAEKQCEEQHADAEQAWEKTLEECIKDAREGHSETNPGLATSIVYSVTWLVFKGVIVFLLCSLSNAKKETKV